jgi:tryptophanyl-tRNA synthetase
MRPTGRLHLGNYLGTLENWVRLQDDHECYFTIVERHALNDNLHEDAKKARLEAEKTMDLVRAAIGL